MRPFISLISVTLLLAGLVACERGGDQSVTGVEGTPVAIRLQAVNNPNSDFDDEIPPFVLNPEGCTEYCGETDNYAPEYVEIMVSVDGGDAETIYNGAYSSSLAVTIPNGEVVILVFIYNCDCCVAFFGGAVMDLPGDGDEVTIEMTQEELNYQGYIRDNDEDGYGDEGFEEPFCRDPAPEEGWLPLCFDDFCDCNDDDSEINPDAPEICDDEVDNDCDLDEDCDDEDCFGAPNCGGGGG